MFLMRLCHTLALYKKWKARYKNPRSAMAFQWGVSCHSSGVLLFSGFMCLEGGYWTWPWLFLSSISFFRLMLAGTGKQAAGWRAWVWLSDSMLQWRRDRQQEQRPAPFSLPLGWAGHLGPAGPGGSLLGPGLGWDPPVDSQRNSWLAGFWQLRSGPGVFSKGEVLNKHILSALMLDPLKAFKKYI